MLSILLGTALAAPPALPPRRAADLHSPYVTGVSMGPGGEVWVHTREGLALREEPGAVWKIYDEGASLPAEAPEAVEPTYEPGFEASG